MNIPILLEEEYKNTIYLIERVNKKTNIIIPHLGALNGGYQKLKYSIIWEQDNVFTDTALADDNEIIDFIKTFGIEKIFFGSDFPFGNPYYEKIKILNLKLTKEQIESILFRNILKLLKL